MTETDLTCELFTSIKRFIDAKGLKGEILDVDEIKQICDDSITAAIHVTKIEADIAFRHKLMMKMQRKV